MRAVVDDPELSRLKGVRSIVIARLSWMIGFSLAALGGVLFAGGQNLNAIVLTLLVLNAYGAAMVGRLTSLPMTFAGALLLGLLQELTNVTWLWPDGDVFLRVRLALPGLFLIGAALLRSEEHTSELQSLMRISYAVFCLKKKNQKKTII